MKKNGKKILCFALSVVVGFNFGAIESHSSWGLQKEPVKAQAAEADENGFVIEDGVLTKYKGEGGDVKIPKGVTGIGGNAFYECESLTSVEIPGSVTSIGRNAFFLCTGLTSIEIPNSVTNIEGAIFSSCWNLKEIQVANGNSKYSSIDGILFTKDYETLVEYPEGKEAEHYSIPNSVTGIGWEAFSLCIGLSSVEYRAV